MSQNKVIRLILLLSLLMPAMPAMAQEKPKTEKPASKTESKGDKSAAKKKDAEDATASEPDEGDASDTETNDVAPKEDADVDEEGSTETSADEDSLDALERKMDEEFGDDEEKDKETDTDDQSAMTLSPPKTVELDMAALGKIDPEKDLAEGGTVDKQAESAKEETWTERAMDILELHGYYRLRPELYHKFNIRNDDAVYPRTVDLLHDTGKKRNSTSTGANMRFRLEPTLNISEEIRIKTQIDFLDNVMLGSTPRYYQGYGYGETENTTISASQAQGWDMGPPDSEQMVNVRRVWGEVNTPLGQLRFGRMGDHFGTGMLHNAGNELFNDFGDTVDRIMFAAKINDWLIAPAFDFPNEGMWSTNASGRPFDVSQLDDAYRLVGIFGYIHDKEIQEAMLRRGDWLVNAGLYFSYRWQVMSFENSTQSSGEYDSSYDDEATGADDDIDTDYVYDLYKREMWSITPDLWFQLLYGTFHLELEAALIFGEIGNPDNAADSASDTNDLDPITLLQWGMVLQIDYGLLSDALRIGVEFGYAHGDKDVANIRAPSTYDQDNNPDNDTYTAFSFNPAYNTDLILHRHILGSVSQSFYLKAWLNYDFLKNPMGRKLSIRGDIIYSRAIYGESTISGDSANLGVELNAQIRYQSADGFYAGLAYGVLFPLAAFKGDPDEDEDVDDYMDDTDLAIPQTVQAVLGITF